MTSDHQRVLDLVSDLLDDVARDDATWSDRTDPNWQTAGQVAAANLDSVIGYLTGVRSEIIAAILLDRPTPRAWLAPLDLADIIEANTGPGFTRPQTTGRP